VKISENLYQFLCRARDAKLFIHQKTEPVVDSAESISDEPFVYLSRLPRDLVKAEAGRLVGDGNGEPSRWNLSALSSSLRPNSDPGPTTSQANAPLGHNAHLWVDALCINQYDLSEKSLQVGMMGAIYESAERVLVWLGPREPTHDVLWALEEFVPSLFRMVSGKLGRFRKKSLALTDHVFTKTLGEELCERWRRSIFGLVSFFSRSCWFSRGWVVQEAFALPVGSVAVLAGRKSIRFEQVLQLTHILDHHFSFSNMIPLFKREDCHDPEDKGFFAGSDTISSLRSFGLIQYHLDCNTSPDNPWQAIIGLLDKMFGLKFADPRDHVYGCLGMIRMMVGQVDGLMTPNYGLTARGIFISTATLILQNITVLDILFSSLARHGGHRGTPNQLSMMPSWVPNFSTRKRENPLTRPLNLRLSASASTLNVNRAHLAEVYEGVLFIEGARFDTVSDSMSISAVSSRRHLRANWLLNYLFRDGRYHFGDQTRAEAILRTLAAGSGLPPAGPLPALASAREWYALTLSKCFLEEEGDISEFFASRLRSVQHSRPWLPTYEAVLKMMGRDDAGFLEVRSRNDWYHLIKSNTVGRSIIETDKGYLVLGPRAVKSADEIWIINGSRLPVVLRRSKDREGY